MYVFSQKNSRCSFSVFEIFGLRKIRKIQFSAKIPKVANNKIFLFMHRMLWMIGQNEDKGCMSSHKKNQDAALPSFCYFAYEKYEKLNFCQK